MYETESHSHQPQKPPSRLLHNPPTFLHLQLTAVLHVMVSRFRLWHLQHQLAVFCKQRTAALHGTVSCSRQPLNTHGKRQRQEHYPDAVSRKLRTAALYVNVSRSRLHHIRNLIVAHTCQRGYVPNAFFSPAPNCWIACEGVSRSSRGGASMSAATAQTVQANSTSDKSFSQTANGCTACDGVSQTASTDPTVPSTANPKCGFPTAAACCIV
mmetsp:Transcript_26378/g.85197  ORF Transcript_26378/g.85197 Transcript_26378/m.85197 type:complete len:212 (-) Transcript_26378:108-743(-)